MPRRKKTKKCDRKVSPALQVALLELGGGFLYDYIPPDPRPSIQRKLELHLEELTKIIGSLEKLDCTLAVEDAQRVEDENNGNTGQHLETINTPESPCTGGKAFKRLLITETDITNGKHLCTDKEELSPLLEHSQSTETNRPCEVRISRRAVAQYSTGTTDSGVSLHDFNDNCYDYDDDVFDGYECDDCILDAASIELGFQDAVVQCNLSVCSSHSCCGDSCSYISPDEEINQLEAEESDAADNIVTKEQETDAHCNSVLDPDVRESEDSYFLKSTIDAIFKRKADDIETASLLVHTSSSSSIEDNYSDDNSCETSRTDSNKENNSRNLENNHVHKGIRQCEDAYIKETFVIQSQNTGKGETTKREQHKVCKN